MKMLKQLVALMAVITLISSVSVSAISTPGSGSQAVLTGQQMKIQSTMQDAYVFIFDLTTMQEASAAIYQSYNTYQKSIVQNGDVSTRDASGEWPYGDTTIVSYLYIESPSFVSSYYGAQMESYAGYQLSSLGSRVRIYSSSYPSVSDSPLADSGYIHDTYVVGISAIARTSSSAANGVIGIVSGEHETYGFFSYTLRGNF